MEHTTDEQAAGNEPTHEQIAPRAFARFISRGATHGQDLDDWLCAERELRHEAEERPQA